MVTNVSNRYKLLVGLGKTRRKRGASVCQPATYKDQSISSGIFKVFFSIRSTAAKTKLAKPGTVKQQLIKANTTRRQKATTYILQDQQTKTGPVSGWSLFGDQNGTSVPGCTCYRTNFETPSDYVDVIDAMNCKEMDDFFSVTNEDFQRKSF